MLTTPVTTAAASANASVPTPLRGAPQRTSAPLKLWPSSLRRQGRFTTSPLDAAVSCPTAACRPALTAALSGLGDAATCARAPTDAPRRGPLACRALHSSVSSAATAVAAAGTICGADAAGPFARHPSWSASDVPAPRAGRGLLCAAPGAAPLLGGWEVAGGGRNGIGGRGGLAGRAAVTAAAAAAAASTSKATTVSPAVLRIADGLPIRECLEEVLLGLDRSNGLVLQAPPGAGKTTVVPLALLRHGPEYLAAGERILVLEPRRVAAKGAARRMAASLNEPVGATVGYRVRLDSKVSSSTRIEVVTEGILLRRLQHDPELAGVGAVVFDEFHERNLDADLALALCLDVQRLARPDLRLVVMSATLGGGLGDRVRGLMAAAAAGDEEPPAEEPEAAAGCEREAPAPGIPLVVSEGRSYPVSTVYLGRPDATERGSLERAVADAVARALRDGPVGGGGGDGDGDGGTIGGGGIGGDVLAFLPGVGEIRQVERLLEEEGTARKYGARVLQLHGNMAPDDQDEVLRPPPSGGSGSRRRQRRVILATPIAESSVTIDGVTAVVDCGLRRAPRYDPATAINRLDTILISDASAEQRRGRAGRTAPGRCYRLWSERDALPAVSEPEILTADLTPTALELALWGSPDGSGLPWLDPPPRDLMEAGRELLKDLGAVDTASGRPTGHGRVLARLGVHPRWGHAVLRGAALGCAELAAVVATMLGGERDLLRGAGGAAGRSADIMIRLEALAKDDYALDRAAARRVLQGARSMAAMAAATAAATARRAAAAAAGASTSYDAGSDGDDDAVAAALAAAGDLPPLESADASQDDEAAGPAESSDTGSAGTSSSPPSSSASPSSSSSAAALSRADFDAAWRQQMQREGLVGALVAAAYPDRIAERRERSNKRAAFTLASGNVVRLPSEDDPLGDFEYLAVAEIGGVGPAANWRRDGGGNDTVRSAAGLTSLAIERYLKDMIQERDVVFWASGAKAVKARRQKRLGCLVLAERSVPITDAAAVPALLQGFKEMGGVRALGLSREMEAWRQRIIWLRSQAQTSSSSSSTSSTSTSTPAAGRLAALPDLRDSALLASAREWLVPHLAGVRGRDDLLKLNWGNIIKSLVPWDLQQLVEAEAPSHLTLPTGTRALVDYSGARPAVRCRLQEVFGLPETPLLAGGRVPLTLELTSPAGSPAAVTSDLASFWRNSYPEVRRELRGRYPKHVWPDDPLEAEATRLTKKQLARAEAQAAEAAATAGGKAGTGGKGGGGGAGGKGGSGGAAAAGASKKKASGGGGGKKK